MESSVKNLISTLKMYGNRESNSFVKFFFFYMCFDAWVTNISGESNSRKKIEWFLSNDNCLKDRWLNIQGQHTKAWLRCLQHYSPVHDTRPGHEEEFVELNDIDNLDEVVWFIYQIRCNMFHGSKNPFNHRDSGIIDSSALILEKWIEWAFHECS